MKKLIIILLPFLASNLFAVQPTKTTGSLGLLKPATGQYSGRPPGDMLNSNFDIIDASVTTNLTSLSALSVATRTIAETNTWVLSDEGTPQGGNIKRLNCVGIGVDCTQSGSTGTLTVTASGSGGSVGNSTQTIMLKANGNVFLSTISVCGIPGACHSVGFSTINIVGVWADQVVPSTVGWTKVEVAFSTGGLNGLPVSKRFWSISVATGSSTGIGSTSIFTSSTVKVRAGETFGVQVTSLPVSGLAPQDLRVHFDYWEEPRY